MFSRKNLLIAATFFALSLTIYGGALESEFVRWDDDLLVYDNPIIKELSPRALWRAFTSYDPELYIPFTFISYQLDHLFGGTTPFIYHVTNLLLHTLNALLVCAVSFLLARRNLWIGIVAGLLFLVHPINTEAALWISARKDVLSTFFFLLSILWYLQYRNTNTPRTYKLSIAAFACGLLSKVMVITLPAVLLLIDWREEGRLTKEHWKEKIPYFVLAALFAVIAFFGKTGQVQVTTSPLEMPLMAAKSISFYLSKLFVPLNLSVIYPYDDPITVSNPDILLSTIVVIALIVATLFSLKKTREAFFAYSYFLGVAAPTYLLYRKGFNGAEVFFASDRYIHLSTIGFFFLVAVALHHVIRSKQTRNTVALVFIGTLSVLAHQQSQVWKSSEALFENALRLYPTAQAARNNLGTIYYTRGDLKRAEEEYLKTLEIRTLPSTLGNLGAVYRRQGKLNEARAAYEEALALNPGEPVAHLGLGIVYAQAGRIEEARTSYRNALNVNPQFAKAYLNLGALEMQANNATGAIDALKQAITIDPTYTNAHFNLGTIYVRQGRVVEAQRSFEQAVRSDPTFLEAVKALTSLYLQNNNVSAAKKLLQRTLKYYPENREIRDLLERM